MKCYRLVKKLVNAKRLLMNATVSILGYNLFDFLSFFNYGIRIVGNCLLVSCGTNAFKGDDPNSG